MDKTLDSGAKLKITIAPFSVGNRLLKAVTKELETVGINLGMGKGKLNDFFNADVDTDGVINSLKNVVFRLISSETIEVCLWECMERATYQPFGKEVGLKITRETFEDEKVRGDYLIVAKEVLVANLSPFFPSLGSKLSTGLKNIIDSQSTT